MITKIHKFQEECRNDINILLKEIKIEAIYEVVECEEDLSLGHKKGDAYFRYQFNTENNKYDIYIYTDQAGAYINDTWYTCELPDYDNNINQLKLTFIEFLKLTIACLNTNDALNKARGTIGINR